VEASGDKLNIFDYTDYRQFLRDYYRVRKSQNPHFSFKSFAMRAKLSSPNYLKLVMDGDRRITDKNIHNFIRGLGLEKQDADYFKNLVYYNESHQSTEDKKHYLDQMIALKARYSRQAKIVSDEHIEFLKNWFNWAIRELVLLDNFSEDPRWIANTLGNKITPKQAEESLKLLVNLGYLETTPDGDYQQTDALLSTGDNSHHALLVRNLHFQFTELALKAILNETPERRESSGLTIAVKESSLPAVKNLIREFRQNLNKVLSTPVGTDAVYHLQIHLFPLARAGDITPTTTSAAPIPKAMGEGETP
jgi:uncharacterized protein (TIGR02147 family)